jgi:hypothetical protein
MDAIKLRYITFALKDMVKRWLYTLGLGSITLWASFCSTFLEKYYPTHLTIKKKKEIMLCQQKPRESFWKYFERFRDLLTQCPHHGLDRVQLVGIIYEGVDIATKTLLESTCHDTFLDLK